ncbi:MAG: PAS domain-containing protein [Candidatus Pacebacteria bacterium]|nr:PAS domain-containing protein [Candidatus Paceibacterota bacterium]
MKNKKIKARKITDSKQLALYYMNTLVDVARESFLILDADFRVLSANPTFYRSFLVSPARTENRPVYELGNGQWNIPKLMSLLRKVLPNKKVIENYEVTHIFPKIGKRTMLLNARQVDKVQLIILAIEDVTERKQLEEERTKYTEDLEVKVFERTKELSERLRELESLNKTMVGRELKMVELKKQIENLEKRIKNNRNGKVKNGNGTHKNGRRK